ncbi:MAG: Eco57I restriction-modification methylase domain-containing protein [Tepidisphaerales bacterium]
MSDYVVNRPPGFIQHNPDILTCLANLSADEVFTPPKLASAMLDLLPQELFRSPETTFLDPCCKSGVFLREIARRLNEGLKDQLPDPQQRVNHILTKQVFGLATSELTALISRRTLYCSKKGDGKYSVVTLFRTPEGNIRLPPTAHAWDDGGRCEQCGASRSEYERDESRESYAYPFIHGIDPKELFNVKFDVIVGNPPYQLDTGGAGRQAIPLYPLFVEQAKRLSPRYITMVTPARWFAGGMGLDKFRTAMLKDKRIRALVDFTNSKDCFPGVSISGGVCYFLWDSNYGGPCQFTSMHDGKVNVAIRFLDEFDVLVRYNEAIDVIHKVRARGEPSLSEIVSPINPFGFATSVRGGRERTGDALTLYSSRGVGYVSRSELKQGHDKVDKYKVMVSQTTSEHAGEPNKGGAFRVLSTVRVLKPGEICTFSYIVLGAFESLAEAENLAAYIKTRFTRFLILQAVSSIHLSREKFGFVPLVNFDRRWSDEELYRRYGLTADEVGIIERLIRD